MRGSGGGSSDEAPRSCGPAPQARFCDWEGVNPVGCWATVPPRISVLQGSANGRCSLGNGLCKASGLPTADLIIAATLVPRARCSVFLRPWAWSLRCKIFRARDIDRTFCVCNNSGAWAAWGPTKAVARTARRTNAH